MKAVCVGALLAAALAGRAFSESDNAQETLLQVPESEEAPEGQEGQDGQEQVRLVYENGQPPVLSKNFTEGDGYNLDDYVCKDPAYEISIFNHSPLVLYIKDFISPFEREHLMRITKGTFKRSNVASADGDQVSSHRTSSSTTVGSDPVTNCISQRARRFQGFDMPITHLEPIQLVSYAVGQQYHFHTDWFPDEATGLKGHAGVPRGGNRVSSIFAYIDVSDDIAGGGTKFPKLPAPSRRATDWCDFIECDQEYDEGVTFRAVAGNAVYWTNLLEDVDGSVKGDGRVVHSGLPVLKGSKLGMNIWTKEGNFG